MSSVGTDPRIGSELLGYRIEALLGRGGMGVVYRAYDARLKRQVALKLVAPELSGEARFRERFLEETEVAASLEHPNVVPVYDAGEVAGQLYLVMRHVEGSDLKSVLEEERMLEPARALAICAQIAGALDAAHERGLVHRDVKPSNVLLDSREHVYLADFGLSRRLAEQGPPTGPGLSLGTPAYISPEQITGGEVDGRADQYSLGCLLYECLTGEMPFQRASELAVLFAHLEDEPPAPPGLEDVIAHALAKSPDQRFPSCRELIQDAREALGLRDVVVLRDRKPLLLAGIGALVAAGALAAGLVLALGGGNGPKRSLAVSDKTLVRIDPKTNKIAAAIEVGSGPKAVAVGGRTVWVYNVHEGTVSAIDSRTNEVHRTTRVSASPRETAFYVGPVIAADDTGAWVVGSAGGKGILTRVRLAEAFKPEYRLAYDPVGVAVGEGAVWVLAGRGTLGDRTTVVLRISPRTGAVLREVRLPSGGDVLIDGIAVGEGAVWLMNSTFGDLYRIDPGSLKVTGRAKLRGVLVPGVGGESAPPTTGYGYVWALTAGPRIVRVHPQSLRVTRVIRPPVDVFHAGVGEGAVWWKGSSTVVRLDPGSGRIAATIPVAPGNNSFPFASSTIAAGAGGVWVTVGLA